jgi:glycosyltransferase involved in cell wall biosynthesis
MTFQFNIFAVMKILFLVPYPFDEAPSQRFRFEQYDTLLSQKGFETTFQSFLSHATWKLFYGSGNVPKKGFALLIGFLKRLLTLLSVPTYDYVLIHREVTPVGPPIFEWIIAKVFRKKIIYDFDDAIWLTDKTNESELEKIIRWRSKVASICKWSYKVSCGNEYLAAYAKQFNSNVVVNPTTIDTERVHNPELTPLPPLFQKERGKSAQADGGELVIGWTGSHSTLKYLSSIESVLQTIEHEFPHVSFLVIADRKTVLKLTRLNFIPWNKETEASDLQKMDIGIMPLPDDEWAKGKCGFKALQYMAMEIPCVVSPVGVNTSIIEHGVNGFLGTSEKEWESYLRTLINDAGLRKNLGEAGRKRVVEQYSVKSNAENFLKLFS